MATRRVLTAALIALLSAFLATAGRADQASSAPRLPAAEPPAPALPSAAVPAAGFAPAPFAAAEIVAPQDAAASAVLAAPVAAPAALAQGRAGQAAAFAKAVADPKNVAAGLDRVYEKGGAPQDAQGEDAGALARFQGQVSGALAAFNERIAGIRVGRFGVQLRAELEGSSLSVDGSFTLDGLPLTPPALESALRSGELAAADWRQARTVLARITPELARSFARDLQQATDPAARSAAVEGGRVRTVLGPAGKEPRLPPNLASWQIQRLVDKLMSVDQRKSGPASPRLQEQDLARLAHVLSSIDRRYMDAIPQSAWSGTLDEMARLASRAYHPERYDWSKTVTLMLKLAARRLLDPHSAYWSAEEFKALTTWEAHRFAGIGTRFALPEPGIVDFVSPGGAAEKAGLKPGDRIVAIDGRPAAGVASFKLALAAAKDRSIRIQVLRRGVLEPEIVLGPAPENILHATEADDFARITLVKKGSPAEKAGLRVGDVLVSIDGVLVKEHPGDVPKLIRGQEGSALRLTIQRNGKVLPEMTVVRASVNTPNSFSKMAAPGIGYVYLAQFSGDSAQDVASRIAGLRAQGARKLVLDLRGNLGGDAQAASFILASFFKQGQPIVTFKRQGDVVFANFADGDGAFSDMPVAVLVNAWSASSSEMTAGALQDVRGPVLVGTRTYGKGTGHAAEPDEQGRALQLTEGRWYTPNGRNINAQRDASKPKRWVNVEGTGGLTPDHAVALAAEHEAYLMDQLRAELTGDSMSRPLVSDPQLDKALQVLEAQK